MKIKAFIGLPGSGKSFVINEYLNKDNFLVFDDPKNINEFPDFFDGDIIIADCHLCLEDVRSKFLEIITKKYPNHSIELNYFENNPEQCLINSLYRKDGRKVSNTIKKYSAKYTIPENSIIIPVFDTRKIKKSKTLTIK